MVARLPAHQREIELKAEAERQAIRAPRRARTRLRSARPTALSKAAATSYELMDICDRNARNGCSRCSRSSRSHRALYKDFVEWLKADNYKALKSHDVDHSGDISRVELEQIVSNYFDEVGARPPNRAHLRDFDA